MSDCGIYGNKNWQRAVDKVEPAPAATGSEPKKCKHCGKAIVQDTAGRGWRHGSTGPSLCCETRAEPGTPPSSQPTVTLDRETFDKVRWAIEAVLQLPNYPAEAAISAETCGHYGFLRGCVIEENLEDALALLRAAGEQR